MDHASGKRRGGIIGAVLSCAISHITRVPGPTYCTLTGRAHATPLWAHRVAGRVAIGSAVGAIEASKIPTFADARVGRRDESEEAHKRQQKTLVPQRRQEATFGHPSGIPQSRPPNAKAANNDTANASAKASATATARGKRLTACRFSSTRRVTGWPKDTGAPKSKSLSFDDRRAWRVTGAGRPSPEAARDYINRGIAPPHGASARWRARVACVPMASA